VDIKCIEEKSKNRKLGKRGNIKRKKGKLKEKAGSQLVKNLLLRAF
jgi:hypothetical protein